MHSMCFVCKKSIEILFFIKVFFKQSAAPGVKINEYLKTIYVENKVTRKSDKHKKQVLC
jgi:hypothetical protein